MHNELQIAQRATDQASILQRKKHVCRSRSLMKFNRLFLITQAYHFMKFHVN